ncbi:carbonic anhydrase [Neohortaea acidophila]|uniref:Carbonic anhydrase n=1 Tax=Neohortaea acidophila TaxID=245834 RepID=A0A6A6Q225_9PEZI|nr:carbonic anhydrase [Neohortaea acidophila]KAF2486029.1 carbonic anhydrase [Neohortaea acidophila]
MSKVPSALTDMFERNQKHAESRKGIPTLMQMHNRQRTPDDGVMIITCADPRLNPYAIFGLDETAQQRFPVVIRNAGGRTFDALRSIAVLDAIGSPSTIVVMHHSDCGMTHFHDADVKNILLSRTEDPAERKWIENTKYGEMLGPPEDSIREDVTLLRNSPFVRKETQIVGVKYDVFKGTVEVINVP